MKKVEFMSVAVESGIGTVYHIVGIDRIVNKSLFEKLTIPVFFNGDYERYLQGEVLTPARVFHVDYSLIYMADKYRGRIHAVTFCPICPTGQERNQKYADFVSPEYFKRIENLVLEEINDTVKHFAEIYDRIRDYDNF
jgi:hypothetical protein